MKNEINLSNNILRLRHERKLTQEALAEFMGVTKASVSKWETGQSTPDILILSQMASFFDVTIDELWDMKPGLRINRSVVITKNWSVILPSYLFMGFWKRSVLLRAGTAPAIPFCSN